MRENGVLASDVDLRELASQTKNFTGAEIEGLVRAAQSTAMNRFIKVHGSLSFMEGGVGWGGKTRGGYWEPGT